ncbi:MAG: pyridoxine 5'-phosphate synthase [Deltaproteobacteria bacterium]|nr:pyridoxine 5'-phosphate synthase [Deltaproteobacteria bacterium]
MARLCVNIDHVATVRQARRTVEPDPVTAALLCELGGARGITVHLREDRRHIQDRDLQILRQVVRTKLNLEMAATQEMVKIALLVKPDQVTLVPERREEVTTEGGLDVALYRQQLQKYAGLFREAGISLSLFIDPDPDQVQAAHFVGAQYVELCTGPYSLARTELERKPKYEMLVNSARMAKKLGLRVNAGHGLTYENVRPVAALEEVEELNIGHSIVSRAILTGMERAVREMADIIRQARHEPD